jgi:hypothetical protein
MSNKSGRDVVVSHTSIGVIIGLHWDEVKNPHADERKHKYLIYETGAVLESVNKAVDVLMRGGELVTETGRGKATQWREFDQDAQLFDAIVEAEEPEQYFVSRYVLEGA